MKTILNSIIVLFLVSNSSLFAHEKDSTKTIPTQITFAYPIGSNGHESKNISNSLSFNVLYGVNGGLTGFELGSLVNVINGSVEGCQIAGITNVVTGPVVGGQVAGIANVITDSLTGLQIAGITNIVPGSTQGAQIAGIHNFTKGKIEGAQIAGIYNLAFDDITGAQVTGIYNQSLQTMRGAQIGLFNSANVIHGFQLGLINVADSSTGVSIGLLNIVKNGYHSIELFGNEVLLANVAIKTGTNSFYNIYTAGFEPETNYTYGFGLGFGSKLTLAKWLSMSFDITSNYINEEEIFDWQVNILNRGDLTFDLNLNKHIALIGGPSFNAHISELGRKSEGQFTTDIAVNPFYTENNGDYQLQMWIGAKAGLRISF